MRFRVDHRSNSGMTIAEVLISVAISGVMLSSLFYCFSFGFGLTENLRQNQRATQIILEKVEILRLYSWDQVNTPGFIPTQFTDVFDPQQTNGNNGIVYNGTLELLDYPGGTTYGTNIKQLLVTLNWTTGGKIPHTRKLATLIAKNGEQNYVY